MEIWNWIFMLFSVVSLCLSAWVLARQEYGLANIKGVLGPKIYIYHQSIIPGGAKYARIVLPVTFINESPRGGCILKMALSISSMGGSEKHILGWLYEVDIESHDLENPNASLKIYISGNPFIVAAKGATTKLLFFEANTDGYKNDESGVVEGLTMKEKTWNMDLLIWTKDTELYNTSIRGSIRLSDYDQGVLLHQTLTDCIQSNIFYLDNKPKAYEKVKGNLYRHLKRIGL